MKYPLAAAVLAALVVLGGSLPWVTVTGTLTQRTGKRLGVEATITGWSGHVNYLGVWVPNWLVVVAAVGAAGGSWLRWFAARNVHPAVPLTLTVGGLFHTLAFLVILVVSRAGTVGAGSVLSALALFGLLLLTVGQSSSWVAKK
jgi:hypothetical protein